MSQANKIIKYIAIAFAVVLIFNIISGIVFSFSFIGNIFEDDEVGELRQLEIQQDILNLDIEVNSVNITIKESDIFKVETNSNHIKYTQNDTKLSIKDTKRINRKAKDLIIYIPSNILEEVSIDNGAGNINIDKLSTKRLSLDLGAGKVSIDYLDVLNVASIKGGAGEISILGGEINNLSLDMGVGKLTLNAKLNGNNDIDAGVGELNLGLTGKESDYSITVNKGIGSFKIDNQNIVSGQTYGNGSSKISIDGGVGSINVEYNIPLEVHAFVDFIKTYKLLNMINGEEENSYYLTLQVFQGEVDTVLVKNLNEKLVVGKNYEFKFTRDIYYNVEDNIDSIFENTTIKSINETNKEGLDQIQDSIR